MNQAESSELSVIVTVVDGGEVLLRCLRALSSQEGAPAMEVIIPYDDTIREVATLSELFPDFVFLSLGTLTTRAAKDAFRQHDLYDRRRAGGLRRATGRLVAMVEDRGAPRADWAQAFLRLHAGMPHAVIGGAVENAADTALLWAIFFCDFGRYQPPFQPGDREYVTDVNICYKRKALQEVAHLWQEKYQEVTVNWELARRGRGLFLSDRPVVVEKRELMPWKQALAERFHWGRLFARLRGREVALSSKLFRAGTAVVLPVLLFLRHFRRQLKQGRRVGTFLYASPAILLLLQSWALGEFVGYCESAIHGHPSRTELSPPSSPSDS